MVQPKLGIQFHMDPTKWSKRFWMVQPELQQGWPCNRWLCEFCYALVKSILKCTQLFAKNAGFLQVNAFLAKCWYLFSIFVSSLFFVVVTSPMIYNLGEFQFSQILVVQIIFLFALLGSTSSLTLILLPQTFLSLGYLMYHCYYARKVTKNH